MNTVYDPYSSRPISCYLEDFLEIGRGIKDAWVLKDFLPFGGKMLIWGDTNAGKSPLTATLAKSVLEGTPFLRKLPTVKGKVVYCMMPDMGMKEWWDRWIRWELQDLGWPKESLLTQYFPINARIDAVAKELRKHEKDDLPEHLDWVQDIRNLDPTMVVVDVLGESHQRDLTDGLTPGIVYDAWRTVCGGRPGLVFVHHEKKSQYASLTGKKIDDPKHSFSGRMEWLNYASSAIRIENPEELKFKVSWQKTRNRPKEEFPATLNLDTMLMDIGEDRWQRAWVLLEKGEEPGNVAQKITTKTFSLSSARKIVSQIVEVQDAQAEMRREQSIALV